LRAVDTPEESRVGVVASDRTRQLASAALIAALMAGSSWIEIHVGPVPFTLQTTFVLLAALLLTPGWAATSMLLYLVLGAVGLPVFAGGTGGVGVFALPAGGFLVAFPLAAAAGSLVYRGLRRVRWRTFGATVAAIIAVEVVVYAVGVPWLAYVTGLSIAGATAVAMLPFLVPDAIKALMAVMIATAVRRALPD
jgi:biotin transport system substrate-specific component